jgi:VanZ family protein|tara:strand:- start:114 stop:506 length:393 start_codon:yes stop_codon:yes gene_type:complete
MKNNILKLIKYLYYLSIVILLIIYLFPGSIIGYFLYGDMNKQPSLVSNPIGTSINHFFYFSYLTFLVLICNLGKKKFIKSFLFLLVLAIFLELLHFFIPNRAFELNDLLSNSMGVLVIFFLFKLMRKFTL